MVTDKSRITYNLNLKKVLLTGALLFGFNIALGQNVQKSHMAKYITEEIVLDGNMNEAVWEEAETGGHFWQYFPSDNEQAKYQSSFKILYSEKTLFIGVRAEAANGNYVVSSLKRDFSALTNDNFSLLFDTFSDGNTAFFFGVTPYGVRREGLVSAGGDDFNNTWDVKWQAEAQRFDDHYTIEIAIPFTSLKFAEGSTKWRFRPYRWNHQSNEQTTWNRIPQQQKLSSLAYMGELRFENPLGKSRTPFALIPYVNTLSDKDYVTEDSKTDLKVGGDAKIAIGDGMNLDLTFNPDFSNVEVDDIFTNLTRFEILLPEKRQFFIDNSDLFSSFGNYFSEGSPFFSRRIGLARDPSGNLIQNRIIAGARLSGNLNKDWRLGFLNLQTEEDPDNEIASDNNMMFALQRKLGSRSNIGVFIVNRQTFGDYVFLDDSERYNRVIGADYNLATQDNTWAGRFYVHKSFQPNDSKGNLASQAALVYNKNNWYIGSEAFYVNEGFQADLGYMPRKDIFKFGTLVQRYLYPKNRDFLNRHSFQVIYNDYWKPSSDFKKTDNRIIASWIAEFKNQSDLTLGYSNEYIFLSNEFDPTRSENAVPLPINSDYRFNRFNFEYQTNNTKLLTYGANATVGSFYNGDIVSLGAQIAYRIQPWVQFSTAIDYDGIRLPEPYESADIWLVTPRMNITFNKKLFWSTLIQYSNQRNNLGINSRLQWRFAPLSDLYLVYNDNYFTEIFAPRFRSINLKLTYWLNL